MYVCALPIMFGPGIKLSLQYFLKGVVPQVCECSFRSRLGCVWQGKVEKTYWEPDDLDLDTGQDYWAF